MTKREQTPERRKTYRKDVCLPINFIVTDDLTLSGEVVNINCYGIKFKFLFHAAEEMNMVDETLSGQNMTLELGDIKGTTPIDTPVHAKWSVYNYSEKKRIYEVGLDLKLDKTQQKNWKQFYETF